MYLSGGRNELMVPQQKLLALLELANGGLAKKEVMIKMQKDMSPMELIASTNYLVESGQIYRCMVDGYSKNGVIEMFLLPKKMTEVKKNNGKWL
jgi:hypothetical protein